MVGIRSAAVGSAMFGLAAAYSKAEYESGAVHAKIMSIKMVSLLRRRESRRAPC